MQGKRVVTVGGGTGTGVVNESLLRSGVKHIDCIVAVMDSGGITGRMRTDSKGEEIAYSDGLRSLLSLINPKHANRKKVKLLKDFLRRRNKRGQDLGYTIFSHYYDGKNGFEQVQELLETLTDVKFLGKVIPVTLESTNIVFQTKSGITYHGEHELDDKRMSADEVRKMWLDPPVVANPKALATIKQADYIFFACGSLHGSVLVNLLPSGIKGALAKSRAKKILITNLASTRNATHNYTPLDFIKIFQKYSGLKKPLDGLVVPSQSRQVFETKHPDVAKRYMNEHSHFLGWKKEELKSIEKIGCITYAHNATIVDPVLKRIRHDPKKLAITMRKIIS